MSIVLSLSGGMDSATALALAVATDDDVHPIGFRYGQRHVRELRSAEQLAQHYGLQLSVVDLPTLSGPSLTLGEDVPHGHYAEETMRATVVQGRNLIFASLLVGQTQPGDQVWLGVHTGDHAIYPDCRPTFIDPLRDAVAAAYTVDLMTPFIDMDKARIAQLGRELRVPYELTWSCYEGGERHCGRCGTCVERAEAFHLAGVPDPTDYADPEFWKQAVADYQEAHGPFIAPASCG